MIIVACLPTVAARCQDIDDLAGASQPVIQLRLKQDGQYKRVHQLAIRLILLDRFDEARSILDGFVKEHPDDAESYFVLGILHAQTDKLDKSVAAFQTSIELGLPRGRILAGPRSLMKPLANHEFYRKLLAAHAKVPVHGPLVGDVTDSTASIWFRTAEASSVTINVYRANDPDVIHKFGPISSNKQNDFTAVVRIDKLKPDTVYDYSIGTGPLLREPHWRFKTFPKVGQAAKFTIAFGGGAGFVPSNEHMWNTIASFDPLALLLLGDNVYIDDPESPLMQRYTYYRRQSRSEWKHLTAQTGVFTIWDDHDFSTNDSWGGPSVVQPLWKRQSVWPIFRENWANPAYAGGEEQPGCWYRFSMGDVDFFMLDCRYYRTDPKSAAASMLGPVQLKWLKENLHESHGTFKVICSSVPWNFRTKGDSLDTWNGFPDEREVIFSFLEEQQIEGVILLSADRHRSDAWQIHRPDGYDLFEFNSSRLTNQHVHPTMEKQGALFSYNKKQSFGLVTFDTTAADAMVRYDVISIDGETVHSLPLRRSQLQRR